MAFKGHGPEENPEDGSVFILGSEENMQMVALMEKFR